MGIRASRSLRAAKSSGEPLPLIPALSDMYRDDVFPRHGQIAMLAGRPGSQKSGFAMWLVAQWGLPCLYVDADMGPFTAASRLGAIFSGFNDREVKQALGEGTGDVYDKVMAGIDRSTTTFMHDSAPTLEAIDEELDAFVELYDRFPSILVIDNLLDMDSGGEGGHQDQLQLLKDFKTVARETGAFTLVLHHMKVDGKTDYPAGEAGIANRLSQTPELIWSGALSEGDQDDRVYRLATVKNRSGGSSPSGERYIELIATPNRTSFRQKAGGYV